MEPENIEEQVIQKYQEDEKVMIHLFIQWCLNHDLNPTELYARAYPDQGKNFSLQQAIQDHENEEPMEITHETMMDILQLFENFELAFVLSEEIQRLKKPRT